MTAKAQLKFGTCGKFTCTCAFTSSCLNQFCPRGFHGAGHNKTFMTCYLTRLEKHGCHDHVECFQTEFLDS